MIIVVCGAPRSGTTLMKRIIGRHADIEDPFENENTFWSKYAGPAWYRWKYDTRMRPCAVKTQRSLDVLVDEQDFMRMMKQFVADFYRYSTQLHRDERWVEKCPENTFYADFIRAVFPEAKFVHIYRNPWDVIRSSFRTKQLYGFGVTKTSGIDRYWREVVSAGLRIPNSAQVCYEELVEKPNAVMKIVWDYLEVDHERIRTLGERVGFSTADQQVEVEIPPFELSPETVQLAARLGYTQP